MHEVDFQLPVKGNHKDLISFFSEQQYKFEGSVFNRFVITKTDNDNYYCEAGLLPNRELNADPESIFSFRKRSFENTSDFNAVFIVPTGIGSDIGGHAGDATPAARIIASLCDNLIINPNVVNASDVNEMTENMLYVEGSVITRLLMGTIGLQKVRSNRILAIIDNHQKEIFANAAINTINSARAAYGLNCQKIITLDPPIEMKAEYSESGRSGGRINGFGNLLRAIEDHEGEYDAIALASIISVPVEYHMDYFQSEGGMINPWGGVEALLTHSISSIFNVPSAHAPMFESEDIANLDPGIVDPRMAAEAISVSFLQCLMKGLQRSPKIITDTNLLDNTSLLSAKDVSCLIIPDGCLGLPTLAALEQGIPVIAVEENSNVMENDLNALPWQQGKFYRVKNYLEAAGVIAALKSGMSVESIRRPFSYSEIIKKEFQKLSKISS